MANTCPISPYPKWLGVVVKAEKYSFVRCRVLNCSNGSLSLVLCRFSTFLIRRNDPKCNHQDQVSPFFLGYIYGGGGSFPWPRGGPSLDQALGPAYSLTWASRFYTPSQSPLKILLSGSSDGEKGFDDIEPMPWLAKSCPPSMPEPLRLPGTCS